MYDIGKNGYVHCGDEISPLISRLVGSLGFLVKCCHKMIICGLLGRYVWCELSIPASMYGIFTYIHHKKLSKCR